MSLQMIATLVPFGPLFAGDGGPALELHLLWDNGGFVQLQNAEVTVSVRRWDPRRKLPYGAVVTSGVATVGNAAEGVCTFAWADASPITSVPRDPGWYMLQARVTFASGEQQHTQRAIVEVLPAGIL